MSVLVEAITVVVRSDAVDLRIPGGVTALGANSPNSTFRTDGKLAAVGFFSPTDVEVYILTLQKAGLRFVEQGKCRDIVVIDQIHGPTLPCDWIEIGTYPDGTRYVWLRGTARGAMVAHRSWELGTRLTLRPDIGIDQLDLDPETGLRSYVDVGGVKQYLGEAFSEGHPEARMLRSRPRIIREAKRATWDALLKRGWFGIAVSQSLDPDFHLAMRYENQLGLIFVAANWSSTPLTEFDLGKRERLLARAKELRGVAILSRCTLFAPIHIRSSGEERRPDGMTLFIRYGDLEVAEPSVSSLTFDDVVSDAPLSEMQFDTWSRIEISDWELSDFAIQFARNQLEHNGYQIDGWTSEPGTGPNILARKDNTQTRVIVGAARYPAIEPIFDRDRLMSLAETTLIEGGQLAKASVALAPAAGELHVDHALPLYRGEPAQPTFRGLEIVDPTSAFADRTVKIFVCSTFREFAVEREAIARKVVPELQRRASRRGVHVTAIDLRWGVTRAESAAGLAVERCLSEVRAADPFFVGLIGQDHGTLPPTSPRGWGDEIGWLMPEASKASITELEIRCAMLHPKYTNPSALIYYRSRRPFPLLAEVPDIAAEFRPLLAALQQRGYETHAIDKQFEEHITGKLWETVSRHYPGVTDSDSVLDDFRKHRQYGLRCAMSLPIEARPVREIAKAISLENIGRIACTSSWEAAALAGALSLEIRKASPVLTFEHYPSLMADGDAGGAFNTRLAEFCRRSTMRVGGGTSSEAGEFGPARELAKLQEWATSANRRVLIVIGGSDLFGDREDRILEALRPSASISVILTRTNTTRRKQGFDGVQWTTRELAEFVRAYLDRHRKKLDAEDAAALLAHPLSRDLSYLRFVCDWLVTFARFETISDALQDCLRAREFEDLAGLLMDKGQAEMSDRDWSRIIKATLANARGCAEADLISGAGLRPAEAHAGLSILSPMLEMWSGRMWRHRGRNWDALANALLAGRSSA
jgi:hypothetical protein